jgi:hypothetical protein
VSENLIIFVKSEFISEKLFKESHGLNCDFKDEGCQLLHVLKEGFNAIKRHWNVVISFISLENKLNILASNKAKQIGWKQL